MLAALLVAGQLAAGDIDCNPRPLPPAILHHKRTVHKHRSVVKPHAKRKSQQRPKRQPAPVLECRPHVRIDAGPDAEPQLDIPQLDIPQLADNDGPPPFTPDEAWPESYTPPPWPGTMPGADSEGLRTPPWSPPPARVPEPATWLLLGLSLAYVVLWLRKVGRRV